MQRLWKSITQHYGTLICLLRRQEEGSTTVEYAIGAVAAAGFAGLLLIILKSDSVRAALEGIIQQALTTL